METPAAHIAPIRPPRGFHTAKVDQAGRVKMPAKYQEYLGRLEDRTLFVTKLHGMARIYTNGSWERNLAKLDADPSLKLRYTVQADRFGGDVEMDPQGRITLPQVLRQDMKLENESLQLRFFDDIVLVYTPEQFQAVVAESEAAEEQDRQSAAELGFV
jgi:MraZ protein